MGHVVRPRTVKLNHIAHVLEKFWVGVLGAYAPEFFASEQSDLDHGHLEQQFHTDEHASLIVGAYSAL